VASKASEHGHEGQLSFPTDAPLHPTAPEPVPVTQPGPIPTTSPEPLPAPDATIITGVNTRIRAGNAMQRARAGAIRGALETLARRGLKRLTMAEAADRGGLARATLYNHVRDKDALLSMLLEHESQAVADAFVAAPSLEAALAEAAAMIADHPALIGIRAHEPAALVRFTVPEDGAVRALAAASLAARGCAATDADVDLVLRWLASFVASPSDPQARADQAAALARTLG
jgi:AcrR family transcriptional regulator